MGKVLVEESALQAIASAIRAVNGGAETYKPGQMGPAIQTIMEAAAYLLVDEDGNELAAAFVDAETSLDATENDIRLNKKAVTNEGVTEGTKVIPSYHTEEGYRLITSGSVFSIPFEDELFDFTKLQAIICPYAGSIIGSVAAEKVSLDEKVYPVNSTESLATVTRDSENKEINFGVTNESESLYVVRYFTYKEIV